MAFSSTLKSRLFCRSLRQVYYSLTPARNYCRVLFLFILPRNFVGANGPGTKVFLPSFYLKLCIFFTKLLKQNLSIKWIFPSHFENDPKCFMFIHTSFIRCGNHEFAITLETAVNKIFSIRIGDLIYKWIIQIRWSSEKLFQKLLALTGIIRRLIRDCNLRSICSGESGKTQQPFFFFCVGTRWQLLRAQAAQAHVSRKS